MPKDLYPKLCRPETLKIAANYVLDDQKDDFVPDVFRHQDYHYNFKANLDRLINVLMEMISTWATPSFWGIRPQRGIFKCASWRCIVESQM
jgi:hypothetical protein